MKLRKRFGVVLVLAMLVSMLAMTVTASAAKLNKKKATVTVGKTVTLKVKGTSAKAKWSSSDEEVATVSSKGKVKGVSEGTATIKAKVGSKTYKCKVTVKAAAPAPTPDGGKLEFTGFPKDDPRLHLYGTPQESTANSVQTNVVAGYLKYDLAPHLSGADAKTVTWASSNTDIAVVNGGVVTAVSNGTCKVTATKGSASAEIIVFVTNVAALDDTNPIVINKANFDKLFYKYFEKLTIMTGYFDADGKIMVPTGNDNVAKSPDFKEGGEMMTIKWLSGPRKDIEENINIGNPYREFTYWVVKDPSIDILQSRGTAQLRLWLNDALADVEGKPGAPTIGVQNSTVAWTGTMNLRSVCRYWDDVNQVYQANTFPKEEAWTFEYTDRTRSGKQIKKQGVYYVAKYSNPKYAGQQCLNFRLEEVPVTDAFALTNGATFNGGLHSWLRLAWEDNTKEYWTYYFPSGEVFDSIEVALYKK